MEELLKNKEKFLVDGDLIEVKKLTEEQKELRKEVNKKAKEYLKSNNTKLTN